jgi:hypothetical protein
MFEALEHVPDPEAVLAELARLRRESVRLVVSVPNSRAFGEENPYHLTDYGWDEARRAFAAIDGAVTLRQYLAEGSLIVADDGAPQLEGEVAALEQAEPEYANTFLCLAGFDAGQIGRATAHLNLVATPNHNRYMLELERANIRIWRENLQLARGLVGRADAAAGLLAARLEHETARRAELEAQIVLERAWRDAPRYHMVDRVAGAVGRTPGLSQLARALWRVLRRFSRGPSD